MQRVRIILGAVSDTEGGRALVLTVGLGRGTPTVCLTRPDGTTIDLDVERASIANSGGARAPRLPVMLEQNELGVFRVHVPPGLAGEIELGDRAVDLGVVDAREGGEGRVDGDGHKARLR